MQVYPCMYVYMSICLLITRAKLGSSRGSPASTTNSFRSFKSLCFHGLAQLQNVLQTQTSMGELDFPLSSSTAVTKLAILCRNVVLNWSYRFYLAAGLRDITSMAEELVNPDHIHGRYYLCYLLSANNKQWFISLFKVKYNFLNSSTLEKYFHNYEMGCTFLMRYLPVCPHSYSNKDVFQNAPFLGPDVALTWQLATSRHPLVQ